MSGRRVLWVVKGLGRGGAEQLLLTLARSLPRDGDDDALEVEVAYVLPHKDALVREIGPEVARVHCLAGARPWSWVSRLRRVLREGGFEVVHTHSPVSAAAVRLLAPRSTALMHTEHNVWGRYRRPTRWANALTFGRNDLVIAVSESVRQSMGRGLRSRSAPPTEVLLHGVDLSPRPRVGDPRAVARGRLGLPDDVPVVGTVGNLTPKKDHATLIRAFAHVRRILPDARLVIIGTGPLEERLCEHAAQLLPPGAVHLTGLRDDVPDLLPAFDVFAMSSLHEGLSIALVEALAAGLPVVATEVGGIPEVITPECGVLVPARDPARLATALVGLLRDGDRRERMARAGAARARDFDIQRATDALTTHYRTLGRRGSGSSRRGHHRVPA